MAKQSSQVAVKKKGASEEARVPGAYYWDEPFQALHDEFDRMFGRFMGGALTRPGRLAAWDPFRGREGAMTVPNVDVKETDKAFKFTVELPGIEEKDVELTLSDGLLTIKGEKRSETEEKDENYHLSERSYGSFSRSFRVPDSVDGDKVNATFDKGVLTIDLPKSEEAKKKSRKIGIKSK